MFYLQVVLRLLSIRVITGREHVNGQTVLCRDDGNIGKGFWRLWKALSVKTSMFELQHCVSKHHLPGISSAEYKVLKSENVSLENAARMNRTSWISELKFLFFFSVKLLKDFWQLKISYFVRKVTNNKCASKTPNITLSLY